MKKEIRSAMTITIIVATIAAKKKRPARERRPVVDAEESV